jgi:hypothetical protein
MEQYNDRQNCAQNELASVIGTDMRRGIGLHDFSSFEN